jgi:phage shock protein A
MIRDLQPEITKNMQTIALERVQVERLNKELSKIEEQLASGKRDIERLHSDLSTSDVRFVYAKRTYSSEQVREDLSARFKRFKTQEATASKVRQMLAARERSLVAARDRMDAMQSMKRQLEVEVENLQARLAAVEVAQTNSSMALDDSRLSRTRDLIDEIKTRIDVREELLSVDGHYDGTIQLEESSESNEDLLDEVAAYFHGSSQGVELASKN